MSTSISLLTTVIGPTGCQTQYAYATFLLQGSASDWLLQKITDPNGYATSYSIGNRISASSLGQGTIMHPLLEL